MPSSAPPGLRYLKPLMSSLMLDVAHRPDSVLRLVPGSLPLFTSPDGHALAASGYAAMTPATILGVMVPICGPTNPGDGPCGASDDGETFYRLRGTDLTFGCRLVNQGSDARELEIRLLPTFARH